MRSFPSPAVRLRRLTGTTLLAALAGAAGCGGDSPTGSGGGPPGAPTIEYLRVAPSDRAEPGGELTVSFGIFDSSGVVRSTLTLSGAVTKVIETDEQGVRASTRVLRVLLPPETQPGALLTVTLAIVDADSLRTETVAAPIGVVDETPPTVTGGPLALSGYVAGTAPEVAKGVDETLGIEIRAADNHRLAWVGYRLGAPANVADSVAVSSPAGGFDPRLVVPEAWIGSSPITLFARDAGGRLTEMVPTADRVLVYPLRSAVLEFAHLGERPTDYTYDARRDLLYLLLPQARQVAVFRVGTLSYEAPIAFAEAPGGIDLTPGTDSLLVTLPEARALAIVAVAQPERPTSQVALAYDTTHGRKPERVRVAANGKAIVSLRAGDGTPGERFLEYDLTTGTQGVRSELGTVDDAAAATLFVHSWDRGHILAVTGSACCQGSAMVYVAGRDVFTRGGGEGADVGPLTPISADSAGRGFLFGGRYVTADLATSRWIAPPDYGSYYYSASALSPDGTLAYFNSADGYKTVRVADGAMVEAVVLPTSGPDVAALERAFRLIALPNGQRMVGWTEGGENILVITPR